MGQAHIMPSNFHMRRPLPADDIQDDFDWDSIVQHSYNAVVLSSRCPVVLGVSDHECDAKKKKGKTLQARKAKENEKLLIMLTLMTIKTIHSRISETDALS